MLREKSPCMNEAYPPKEASTFESMDERPQFFSSNKMAHYFKESTTACGVLKKVNKFLLQKFNA